MDFVALTLDIIKNEKRHIYIKIKTRFYLVLYICAYLA